MQDYYPAFFRLNGRTCVVVGGGQVAARKVASFLACGAAVRVVDTVLSPALQDLARDGRVEHIVSTFSEDVLEGAYLAVAATSSPEVNRRVAAECTARGIPVNVVDAPGISDFIVPATVRRGALTIAVSTGGSSPALAAGIRRQLEEQFDQAYAELLEALGAARSRVLAEVDDPDRRRAILTTLAEDTALFLEILREGGSSALAARLDSIIGY